MTLAPRERTIVLVAVAVVALIGVYEFGLDSLVTEFTQLGKNIDQANRDLAADTNLLANRPRLQAEWAQRSAAGLAADASAAESRTFNAIREWAADAGLALPSLKRERDETFSAPRPAGRRPDAESQAAEKRFQRITFRATATGSMASIGRFLHLINDAPIPIRVTDLQFGSRRDGTDDLSLLIGLSTVYLNPEPTTPKPTKDKP